MVPIARIYENKLLEEGVQTSSDIDKRKKFIRDKLEQAYVKSKSLEYKAEDWITEEWTRILKMAHDPKNISSVPIQRLKAVGEKISVLPEDKNFHRLVRKIFEARH